MQGPHATPGQQLQARSVQVADELKGFLMNRMIWAVLIMIGLFAVASQGIAESDSFDLNAQVSPIGIAPANQEGYGNGPRQLAQPDDVEFLPDGRMLVSDCYNNRVQVFDADGNYLKTITPEDMGLSGVVIPTGLSQDAQGYVYISLEDGGVIVRLNPDLTLNCQIGTHSCDYVPETFYDADRSDFLCHPQGLTVTPSGDVFIVDMNPDTFNRDGIRRFGIRKFTPTEVNGKTVYKPDLQFAATQEITKTMHKSEGMYPIPDRNLLLVAEEKPSAKEFGNDKKYRYVAVFDLTTGKFLNRFYGVDYQNGKITKGYIRSSIEGVVVWKNHVFMVDESGGRVWVFNLDSGALEGHWGEPAYWYCDDESDCVREDGINYNEQTIIAGTAVPYLKNDWRKNELASPDGINLTLYSTNSELHMGVIDQWNSRVLVYDLNQILKLLK